jgi:hypothetical protein
VVAGLQSSGLDGGRVHCHGWFDLTAVETCNETSERVCR